MHVIMKGMDFTFLMVYCLVPTAGFLRFLDFQILTNFGNVSPWEKSRLVFSINTATHFLGGNIFSRSLQVVYFYHVIFVFGSPEIVLKSFLSDFNDFPWILCVSWFHVFLTLICVTLFMSRLISVSGEIEKECL